MRHSTSIRGAFCWCVGRLIGHVRGKHRLKTHLVYHSYITRRSIIIRKGVIKLGLCLRTSNDRFWAVYPGLSLMISLEKQNLTSTNNRNDEKGKKEKPLTAPPSSGRVFPS